MKPLRRWHVFAVVVIAAMVAGSMTLLRGQRTVVKYPALKVFYFGGLPAVQSLAFSPDGKRLALATASLRGSFDPDVYDVKQERDQSSEVYQVFFGNCQSDRKGGVYVLNLAEGRILAGGAMLKGWANSLAFTPDGRTLLVAEGDVGGNQRGDVIDRALQPAANGPGKMILLDTKTWQSRAINFPGPVLSVAASPDGRTAAALAMTAGSKPRTEVTLWDLTTSTKTGEFVLNGVVLVPALAGRLQLLAFSPDGTRLAVVDRRESEPGDVVIWDVPKKTVIHTIWRTGASVSFTPNCRFLVVSGKGVGVYDTNTWRDVCALDDPYSLTLLEPLCIEHRLYLAFDAYWFDDERCILIQYLAGKPRCVGRFVSAFRRVRGWSSAIAISPDRRFIAAGGYGRDIVCVWAMPDFPQCKHERTGDR